MNRKRKNNELYKGVFKNDKKGCIVDLKPKDEINQQILIEPREKENTNINIPRQKKTLDLNLRVAKNMKFGTYFQKLRDEIVDIFIQEDEYISFEGLFNFQKVNDLFNFRETSPDMEPINIQTTENRICYEEEVLYQDENETIIKRKKTTEKMRDRRTMVKPTYTEISHIPEDELLNQIFKMPENRYKYN
jgi:hypothetical protein